MTGVGGVDAPSSPARVLVIGLDPYRVPGPWDPRPVADAIEKATARFAEQGIAVENCLSGSTAMTTSRRS